MSKQKKNAACRIITLLLLLPGISCEYDPSGINYHEVEPLPDEIRVGINLANSDPEDIIYVYGNTGLYYEVLPEIGKVEAMTFTFDGYTEEIRIDHPYFQVNVTEEIAGQVKELQLDILIKAENGSLADATGGYYYTTSVVYKIKYVKITDSDFAVKDWDSDKITLRMINKKEDPCKYVINGKVITDLDNIELPRIYFPESQMVKIHFLRENEDVENYPWSHYTEFYYSDKTIENLSSSGSSGFYYDPVRSSVYFINNDIQIYDKNLNFLSKEDLNVRKILVTPTTGKIVCHLGNRIVTYSDNTFSNILSTIEDSLFSIYTNARDQLFMINNWQIDVFDLNSGELIYSIETYPSYASDISTSSDGLFLYVISGTTHSIYQLTGDTANILYEYSNSFNRCNFHPVNDHHVVLTNYSSGFEIYDLESRKTIFSSTKDFIGIDPVTGNIICQDYNEGHYRTYILDKFYKEILRAINISHNTQLLNNYLIYNNYYLDFSKKILQP